jgi:hypothetical protein
MKLDNSTIVTGVLYQHKDSTDIQLLGGLTIGVKLFGRVPFTGFTYRQETSAEDKLLSGSRVTGIVYRYEDGLDDVILCDALSLRFAKSPLGSEPHLPNVPVLRSHESAAVGT